MKRGGISRTGILIIAFCLTAVVSAVAAGPFILQHWQPLREKGAAPSSKAPAQSSPQTTSQTSSAEIPQPEWDGDFTNFLICGIDNTNSLTDVIMLVGFDNKTKKLSVLQIPRDTYAGADIPSHKYNAIYGHHAKGESGMETLKAHVQSDFGIKIGNYVAVTTKGLRQLIDAAGGVDLDVPINMNYDDSAQGLHIHLKAGQQHLNGSQAEQFVRYRKGWSDGDIGRLQAQKIFLAAFAQKLKSMSLWDLATKILPAVKQPNFMTDISAAEILKFGGSAKNINLNAATVYTMPGEPYNGSDGSALYSVHKAQLLEILNKGFVPPGITLKSSDLHIKQKADKSDDESSGGNFEDILNKNK